MSEPEHLSHEHAQLAADLAADTRLALSTEQATELIRRSYLLAPPHATAAEIQQLVLMFIALGNLNQQLEDGGYA